MNQKLVLLKTRELLRWESFCLCRLKKDVQLESCELSFIWGKMRTVAQEAGGSISDSSERLLQSSSVGKSIYTVLVKGEFNTMKYSTYKWFFC